MSKMKIIHWNIASYYSNFEELRKLIHDENNPTCICLQETRHISRKMYPPSRYKLYSSPNQRSDGHERGVALLVDVNTHSEHLNINTSDNIEAVAARVYHGQYYSVCSIYLSPSLTVSKQEISSIINQLPQVPQPALLFTLHARFSHPCFS